MISILQLLFFICAFNLIAAYVSNRWIRRTSIKPLLRESVPIDTERTITDQIKAYTGSFSETKEQVYRKYPFHNVELPILTDCNNYYSGQHNELLWHQNADQLFLFFPMPEDFNKGDIKVDFQVHQIEIFFKNRLFFSFDTFDRIIPDGSFWLVEYDSTGKRYLQLDLEKRYRMINWKTLFRLSEEEKQIDASRAQSDVLQKLFEANKGMAAMNGKPPDSIEDMMRDEELMRAIDPRFQKTITEEGFNEETGEVEIIDEAIEDDRVEDIRQIDLDELREKYEKENQADENTD
jgi:hypothetical protein